MFRNIQIEKKGDFYNRSFLYFRNNGENNVWVIICFTEISFRF